jgi:hypothetical protein
MVNCASLECGAISFYASFMCGILILIVIVTITIALTIYLIS